MSKKVIIIEGRRDAYSISDVGSTMTVGELIDTLRNFNYDDPVYIGSDRQSYGYYTYGRVDVNYEYIEDDEDEEEEEEFDDEYEEETTNN